MTDSFDSEERELLLQILKEIQTITDHLILINSKLSSLTNLTTKFVESDEAELYNLTHNDKTAEPSSIDILDLQESRPGIFRTYKALQKKADWVKSSEIAKETQRSRGLESRYLNYLADNGFVMKKRLKVQPDSKATEVWYRIVGAVE